MQEFRVGELSCVRLGEGPPLLAVHALAFSKKYFVDADLEFDVVAIDQRGHGDSGPVAPEATLQQLAAEVNDVLDYVGWEQAWIAGISLGAALTLSFTLQFPARVTTLIQDLPAFAPTSAMSSNRAGEIAAALRRNDADGALSLIKDGLPPTVGSALAESLRIHWGDLPKLATAFEGIQRWQVTEHWPEDLNQISTPVHVFGLPGDRSHPYEIAQQMQHIPDAVLHRRAPSLDPKRAVKAWSSLP